MKRLLLGLALIAAALGIAAAAGLGGSSYDPLISLSYLEETYLPGIETGLAEAVAGLTPVYAGAAGRLDAVAKPGIAGISARDADMTTAARFTPLPVKRGDVLYLQGGSTVLVTSGAAELTVGVLLDLSVGEVCGTGSMLAPRHRYLSDGTGRAALKVTGALGGLSVQGNYKLTPSAAQALPFADVTAADWFFAAVQYAYDSKLMSGTGETSFAPGGTMTRAMVATVLYRMQETAGGATGQFTDVPVDVWYTDAVNWAAEHGIVTGYGGGLFGPNNPVTREQLAVMLHRYAVWRRLDTAAAATLGSFPDGEKTAAWAQQAAAWAVASGVITGRTDGTLDPGGTATRAEVATMLFRFAVWSAAKT